MKKEKKKKPVVAIVGNGNEGFVTKEMYKGLIQHHKVKDGEKNKKINYKKSYKGKKHVNTLGC